MCACGIYYPLHRWQVVFWNEGDDGRYGVRLEDGGSTVRVKASNLKLALSYSVRPKVDIASPSPDKNSEKVRSSFASHARIPHAPHKRNKPAQGRPSHCVAFTSLP